MEPVRYRAIGLQAERTAPKMIPMRPVDLQQIGVELAIKWDNGAETFFPLEELRRRCPCAACNGETDVMGNVYKGPAQTLSARSFQLTRINTVGGYAIQPFWADGHNTGIYSYEYLRKLSGE